MVSVKLRFFSLASATTIEIASLNTSLWSLLLKKKKRVKKGYNVIKGHHTIPLTIFYSVPLWATERHLKYYMSKIGGKSIKPWERFRHLIGTSNGKCYTKLKVISGRNWYESMIWRHSSYCSIHGSTDSTMQMATWIVLIHFISMCMPTIVSQKFIKSFSVHAITVKLHSSQTVNKLFQACGFSFSHCLGQLYVFTCFQFVNTIIRTYHKWQRSQNQNKSDVLLFVNLFL